MCRHLKGSGRAKGEKKKTDVFIGCKEMCRIYSYLAANGVEIGAKRTYMISHIFKALGL